MPLETRSLMRPDSSNNARPRPKIPGQLKWRLGAAPTRSRPLLDNHMCANGRPALSKPEASSKSKSVADDFARRKLQMGSDDRERSDGEVSDTADFLSENNPSWCRPQLSIRDGMFDELPSWSVPISQEERNMVVKYLQISPFVACGVNAEGPLNPTRDMNWTSVEHYGLGVQHILIGCETLLYLAKGLPPSARLLLRTTGIYQHIANLLANPETQTSNHTIACICSVIMIDPRAQKPEINRIHLKGLARMLEMRGYDSLFSIATFMFHPLACLGYFVRAELETMDMLDAQRCSTRFLGTIAVMQEIVRSKVDAADAASRGQPWQLCKSARHSMVIGPWSDLTNKAPIHFYLIHLLRRRVRDETIPHRNIRFLCLFLINLMLCDFQDSPIEARHFLNRLSYIIDGTSAIDPRTKSYMLRLDVMPWVLAKAWTDIDATSCRPGCGPVKEVYLTEIGFDALKTFARLPCASKDRLIAVLASWLNLPGMQTAQGISAGNKIDRSPEDAELEGNTDFNIQYLSRSDLGNMGSQARSDWYEKTVGNN